MHELVRRTDGWTDGHPSQHVGRSCREDGRRLSSALNLSVYIILYTQPTLDLLVDPFDKARDVLLLMLIARHLNYTQNMSVIVRTPSELYQQVAIIGDTAKN